MKNFHAATGWCVRDHSCPVSSPETLSFNVGSTFQELVMIWCFQRALLTITVVRLAFTPKYFLAHGKFLNLDFSSVASTLLRFFFYFFF